MQDQIAQYTHFIDSLVTNKEALMKHQTELREELQEYEKLVKKTKELLKLGANDSLRSTIELGENIFVQARVPKKTTSTVIVHCGLDVYIEVATEKVESICKQSSDLLLTRTTHLQEQIDNISIDIEQVRNISPSSLAFLKPIPPA